MIEAKLDARHAATDDLVESVIGRAMTELPCLRVASTAADRDALRGRLKLLVDRCFDTLVRRGLDQNLANDDTFVVTIMRSEGPMVEINVSLLLGTLRITG